MRILQRGTAFIATSLDTLRPKMRNDSRQMAADQTELITTTQATDQMQ